ncbi:uncharacterized protein LOC130974860 [Arachis stenosperma]|uniref:uncharacterized protein LOC130974860 n=1 Tax=Arachis stenosperma TaxID=217475 RepID=UPI0025AD3717|nr:uncharacterized protein LOC130974860 [Arachis stenosperma]
MSENVGSGTGSSLPSIPRPTPAVSRRKNATGNRSDIGWKHGIDVQGNVPEEVKAVMLKVCVEAKEASLKKRRFGDDEDYPEQTEKEKDNSQQRGKDIRNFVTKGKGAQVQSTINQMMKKDLKEQCDQQCAIFFYTSAIPFNVIKNPEFLKFCEMVGRYGIGYKPPSYHELRETQLKKAVNNVDEMLTEFKAEWKRTGCSIMSDGWTDKKRHSICNFLVNSPKGTVFLYSLDTSDISKTTDKVVKMLEDAVEFVGEENVVQIVTDNAANYKAAGERMMETRKSLYWTPCAAHCIDLILEDFEKNLKVHETTIKNGRKITTFIYSRSMLISMLRNFTKGKDLVRPGATRFATAYLTLTCLHDNKGPLMTMFTSADWKTTKVASTPEGIRVQNMALDSRLWKNIVICLKAAAPLITVLRLVDSNEKPAMGFIFEGMRNAKETIKTNFGCVKKSYEPIWEIIDGRWESQLHRPLHAAAYYLNPHYHYEPNFMVDDADIKIGLYSCLKKLVPNQEERKKVGLQLPDFHYARGLFGNETAKSSRKTMLPAEWWDFYGDSCPELKKFSIRVLSLTCSSSGCERNWSAFEMVHTKRRNRLHQKKMNDLVYVMYNLKLKGKQIRKTPELEFDAVHSDDEWITEDVNENIAESVEHSHLPINDNTNDDPNSNEFAIPGMNSNEFNMGEGGENEFIGDPQQNLIEEEDEHVNDDEDFVGRVEPEAERNDVSDEDGEDDDVNSYESTSRVYESSLGQLHEFT